jgi:hypothetical protein
MSVGGFSWLSIQSVDQEPTPQQHLLEQQISNKTPRMDKSSAKQKGPTPVGGETQATQI